MSNPIYLLQNILKNNQAMQNPLMSNAMKLYQQGDYKALKEMAENLAKERGTSVEEIRRILGI